MASVIKVTRRKFSGLFGSTLAVGALSLPDIGNAGAHIIKPMIVIIGGGAGGTAAARYIARCSNGMIEVTLIEPAQRYYSGFYSNLYIGGLREYDSIGLDYRRLVNHFGHPGHPGVNVVRDWAASVDRDKRTVTLASGASISYDRLIVSPGIDIKYDSIEGYSIEAQTRMPHGLKSAAQVRIIKRQIANMPKGGTFVMVPPSDSFSCPNAPYERISMIAHYFKKYNPAAKIIILATRSNLLMLHLFRDGWQRHYPGMIDWIPLQDHGGIISVDPVNQEIYTEFGTFKADASLIIPQQKAGSIAMLAGLTRGDWVPIYPSSMVSQADPNIYVVGDTSFASSMPKSAFSAVSQAKVAANVICGELIGPDILEAGFSNTSWSRISENDAVKFEASYKAGTEQIDVVKQFVSQQDESVNIRKKNFKDAEKWYRRFASQLFSSDDALI